jgi:hypothetical protein
LIFMAIISLSSPACRFDSASRRDHGSSCSDLQFMVAFP